MNSFSERMGLKPVRSVIQKKNSMDLGLRNYLWNALHLFYFKNVPDYVDRDKPLHVVFTQIWVWYYHERLDEIPYRTDSLILKIKNDFLKSDWNEVYDFIEFVPNRYKKDYEGLDNDINKRFCEFVNSGLENFLSAYRFVDRVITEITSEQEIQSIEDAVGKTNNLHSVQSHLKRALELMSDRKEPDYRNSIKESISAIEGLGKLISGRPKDTLAASLDKIKGKKLISTSLWNRVSKRFMVIPVMRGEFAMR
ncbi:AbiJ-NTD4 domain-containing protein [Pedobacter sp. NJ-S-72]